MASFFIILLFLTFCFVDAKTVHATYNNVQVLFVKHFLLLLSVAAGLARLHSFFSSCRIVFYRYESYGTASSMRSTSCMIGLASLPFLGYVKKVSAILDSWFDSRLNSHEHD